MNFIDVSIKESFDLFFIKFFIYWFVDGLFLLSNCKSKFLCVEVRFGYFLKFLIYRYWNYFDVYDF